MVYGDQQEVLVAMTTLVLCTIIVVAFIGAGQGMMVGCDDSLPPVSLIVILKIIFSASFVTAYLHKVSY